MKEVFANLQKIAKIGVISCPLSVRLLQLKNQQLLSFLQDLLLLIVILQRLQSNDCFLRMIAGQERWTAGLNFFPVSFPVSYSGHSQAKHVCSYWHISHRRNVSKTFQFALNWWGELNWPISFRESCMCAWEFRVWLSRWNSHFSGKSFGGGGFKHVKGCLLKEGHLCRDADPNPV